MAVFLGDVSILRNLLKLQKVDKGNGRGPETLTSAFPRFCNFTKYRERPLLYAGIPTLVN